MNMDFNACTYGSPNTIHPHVGYLEEIYGTHFVLETTHMLPSYFGHEHEDPRVHLENFELACMHRTNGCLDYAFMFDFFPMSLHEVALDWYYAINSPIQSWEDLSNAFYSHFSTIHQTYILQFQLKSFHQKEGEMFYECWERFNNILQSYPSHHLELVCILSCFFHGLCEDTRHTLDEILDLTPDMAWHYLESIYENMRPRGDFEHALASSTYNITSQANFTCSHLTPLMETKYHDHEASFAYDVPPLESTIESCSDLDTLLKVFLETCPRDLEHSPGNIPIAGLEGNSEVVEETLPEVTTLEPTHTSEPSPTSLTSKVDWSLFDDDDTHLETIDLGDSVRVESPTPIVSDSFDHVPSFTHTKSLKDTSSVCVDPITSACSSSITTPKHDARLTLITQAILQSLNTHSESENVIWPEEFYTEPISPISLTCALESESDTHLSSLDLVPPKSHIWGLVSDLSEIDDAWVEVVEYPKEVAHIDFLGVECRLEHPMFTFDLHGGPYPGCNGPYLATLSLVSRAPRAYLSLTSHGFEENILSINPFGKAWDRVGVG